jgi:hypothetical protein
MLEKNVLSRGGPRICAESPGTASTFATLSPPLKYRAVPVPKPRASAEVATSLPLRFERTCSATAKRGSSSFAPTVRRRWSSSRS